MNILSLLNKTLTLFLLLFTPFLINLVANIKDDDFLVFIDVGQGDATLICTKNSNCGLIDTGKQSNIINSIREFTYNPLEFLIITHPDSDHTLKTLDIAREIGINKVFISKSHKAQNLIDELINMNIPIYELRSNNDFSFGEYNFDVLWPEINLDTNSVDSNETSTSILLSNKSNSFYFAGDLGIKYEEYIQERNKVYDINISKISHHGSKNSSSIDFLKEINPSAAIISTGKNSYGHPSQEVIKRLQDLNINILRTDLDGNVKISISERKLEITTQNTKKSYIILN